MTTLDRSYAKDAIGSVSRKSNGARFMKTFRIEYEYQGQRWCTLVDAYDLEHAKAVFRRDNPQVELLACEEV